MPVTTAAARNDRPVNGAVQTIAASSDLNDWSDLPHSCVPLMSTDDEYSSQMEDYGDYGDNSQGPFIDPNLRRSNRRVNRRRRREESALGWSESVGKKYSY